MCTEKVHGLRAGARLRAFGRTTGAEQCAGLVCVRSPTLRELRGNIVLRTIVAVLLALLSLFQNGSLLRERNWPLLCCFMAGVAFWRRV